MSRERLEQIVAAGVLEEHEDMVWTQSWGEWRPLGSIETLRRLIPKRGGSRGQAPRELSSPVKEHKKIRIEGREDAELEKRKKVERERREALFLRLRSGYGRFSYFLRTVAGLISCVVLIRAGHYLNEAGRVGLAYFSVSLLAILILCLIRISLRRFEHLGMSKSWALIHWGVPIIGLWTGYRLFACPGGYARERSLGVFGGILAVAYWLTACGVLSLLVYYVTAIGPEAALRPLRDWWVIR